MKRNYLMVGMELPPGMPYPRFLADMDISYTAKELYVRLLNKTVMEKESDGNGCLYTRFPIREQMTALSKSDATIKRALLELERAGLLERKRQGRGRPNKLYLLV